jgi:hypothetical protein
MNLKQEFCVLFFLLSLSVFVQGASVYAQASDCAAIAHSAFDQVSIVCESTGRNQVCNGNALVDIVPRVNIENLVFENVGDVVALTDLASLRLSPMDVENDNWGVALMRLQANLPDTLPGQNVTFLMFGDVELTNSAYIDPDSTSQDNLNAFYFHSGIGDAPCEEAPNSGVLVSTPQGVGEVSFRVNGVDIALGSTAFLQSQPNDEMLFNLLEGEAFLSVFGETRRLVPGTRVRIPIDEASEAFGLPSMIEMCDVSDLKGLGFDELNCEAYTVVLDPIIGCGGDLALPAGMRIHLHLGSGFNTEAEAQAAMDASKTSITINGTSVLTTLNGPYVDFYSDYAFGTNYHWGVPEIGEYSIIGTEINAIRTCHITIVEPTE